MNPNRMSCGEARDKLPLYVGGDLDPDVLDAVRGHLDLCGECARRAARTASARRVLQASFQGSEGDGTQPGLWPGIRARLHSEGLIRNSERPVVEAPVPSVRRSRWGLALAPLAAAAVIAMILQLSGGLEPDGGIGPHAIPAEGFEQPVAEVLPVSEPMGRTPELGGTLRFVDPSKVELAAPFRTPRDAYAPATGDASLAGFRSNRLK